MFSFSERLLKKCGNGCQLLWSDPNKQASGYDSVRKGDCDPEFMEEDNFEGTLENDPLTGAIIMSQPSASARAPVWSENQMSSPIVKNKPPSGRGSFSSSTQNVTEKRSVALIHNSAAISPIVKNSSFTRKSSQQGVNIYSSNQTRSSSGKSNDTLYIPKKISKKQKSEEVKMQIVSTV